MVRRSTRTTQKHPKEVEETIEKEPIVDLSSSETEFTIEKLAEDAFKYITSKMAFSESIASGSTTNSTHSYLTLSTDNLKAPKDPTELASELQTGIDMDDLYLKFDGTLVETNTKPLIHETHAKLMSKSVITPDFEKKDVAPPMQLSKSTIRKQKKQAREETAGPKWFNLPATPMTPELKQDLKIMKMRNVLDPKRHYKKADSKELPKYFQVGTVVDGAADFYNSRIPRRQRKRTLVEDLLANEEFRKRNKKKFLQIQKMKEGTKRGFHSKKKKSGRFSR